MKTFSALLALCEGIPPVTGGFPSQRPVTQSFDVFFDLRLNKRLSKLNNTNDNISWIWITFNYYVVGYSITVKYVLS